MNKEIKKGKVIIILVIILVLIVGILTYLLLFINKKAEDQPVEQQVEVKELTLELGDNLPVANKFF